MAAPSHDRVVSSDDELLILVDSDDRQLGTLDKSSCHDGAGTLHRAFSLFVFNPAGELLIQQRQTDKRLWPSFWSNSCCSHPRASESMELAIERRLDEELGLRATLRYVYKFEYSARFGDLGSEHELCWVYVGHTDAQPAANSTEIRDWQWIAPAALEQRLSASPESFTPWFKMEWQRLTGEFQEQLRGSAAAR